MFNAWDILREVVLFTVYPFVEHSYSCSRVTLSQHLPSMCFSLCFTSVVCVFVYRVHYAVYLLTPIVITAMPATRRSSANELSSAAPYSLSGASKPQLTALTVAALKSHLKHFKLSSAGKKSELVDRLHSYLHADSIEGLHRK